MTVTDADLDDPALADFLRAHLADLAPTAPAESRHALDLGGLRGPGTRVWVAVDDNSGQLVGTAALVPLADRSEELKSMRTDPAYRGQGIASILLNHALDDAARRAVPAVLLETGSMDFFAPARALYRKFGFIDRGPFGNYTLDENSVYLELPLQDWLDSSELPAE